MSIKLCCCDDDAAPCGEQGQELARVVVSDAGTPGQEYDFGTFDAGLYCFRYIEGAFQVRPQLTDPFQWRVTWYSSYLVWSDGSELDLFTDHIGATQAEAEHLIRVNYSNALYNQTGWPFNHAGGRIFWRVDGPAPDALDAAYINGDPMPTWAIYGPG